MSRQRKASTARVFISHSHVDRHIAVELQDVLEKHGAETFLDQDTIDALDNLPERIQNGISWCDTLLLLWSASAASSAWVQKEWETAQDWRKVVVPYALDFTPLPHPLDELVHIEASDMQHGNSILLKTILGGDVDIEGIFAGRWKAAVDAFGMAQGTYEFELRENGQVEGEGGISNTGLAGSLAEQAGMGGLLSMRIPLHGSWSYDRRAGVLTIQISATAFGQQQNDTIRIRTTGHETGPITGEDLAGRTWTLWHLGARSRSAVEGEKQRVREAFRRMIETNENSPTIGVTLAAACLGVQQSSQYNLGLPTKKARRVLRADESNFTPALTDFVQALERGGWIS